MKFSLSRDYIFMNMRSLIKQIITVHPTRLVSSATSAMETVSPVQVQMTIVLHVDGKTSFSIVTVSPDVDMDISLMVLTAYLAMALVIPVTD